MNYLVDEQTAFNGPLRAVPGTHRQDARGAPKINKEPEKWILTTMCPLPAGTAIIRDLRTWYGGTPNLTTNHRAMPNAEFTTKHRAMRLRKAMPHEIWTTLSERGRHLARFIRAEEGDADLEACVKFDIQLGGTLGSQDFFNGFELAPLFKAGMHVLPLSQPSPSFQG